MVIRAGLQHHSELQLHNYIHFWTNTLGESINSFIFSRYRLKWYYHYNNTRHTCPTLIDIGLKLKLTPWDVWPNWFDQPPVKLWSTMMWFLISSQNSIKQASGLKFAVQKWQVLCENGSHKLQDKVTIKIKFIYNVKYKVWILSTGVTDNGLVLIIAVQVQLSFLMVVASMLVPGFLVNTIFYNSQVDLSL